MRRMSKAADRLAEGDLGPALRGDGLGAHANQGKDTYRDRFPGPATKFVGCFHRIDRNDSFSRDRAVIRLLLGPREKIAPPSPVSLLKKFVTLQAKLSRANQEHRTSECTCFYFLRAVIINLVN